MTLLYLNDTLPQLCVPIVPDHGGLYKNLSSPVLVLQLQRKTMSWYSVTMLEACGRVTVALFECCHERFYSLLKLE